MLQKQAFTCLAAISFPSGIGAPFSVAMRFSVARAFSWFPVSTSYRALSGSHCSHRPKKTDMSVDKAVICSHYWLYSLFTIHCAVYDCVCDNELGSIL